MSEEMPTIMSEMPSQAPVDSSTTATETLPDDASQSTSEGTLKTDGGDAGDKTSVTDQGTQAKQEGYDDLSRFDKHPRWQEMLAERNQAREQAIAAEARAKALEEFYSKEQKQTVQEQVTERDFNSEFAQLDKQLEDGDIDLNQYRSQLAKLTREQSQAIIAKEMDGLKRQQEEMVRTQTVKEREQSFLKDNPRFLEVKKSGELDKIKADDPYGFHDDLSAYHALLAKEALAEKDAAVAKAIKETEERVLAQIKAKQGAKTLGAGPAAAPADDVVSPELKEPKKFGGKAMVLAQRLAHMRRTGT